MKTKTKNLLLIAVLLILLSSCAETVNVKQCVDQNNVYGFWGGTWHGMILTFSFIGSLFDDSIAIYAVNNNGGWYNFGFVGGFFIMFRIFFKLIVAIINAIF